MLCALPHGSWHALKAYARSFVETRVRRASLLKRKRERKGDRKGKGKKKAKGKGKGAAFVWQVEGCVLGWCRVGAVQESLLV